MNCVDKPFAEVVFEAITGGIVSARELAEHFECGTLTVGRWGVGDARPTPRVEAEVRRFIEERWTAQAQKGKP